MGLSIRHPHKHLEVNGVGNTANVRQFPRRSKAEKIVARNAQRDVLGVLRGECPVENSQVVRIRRALRLPGCHRPAVQVRVNLLHGQVCTLHQSHLDWDSPAGAAFCGPFLQALHCFEAVRKIRLNDNARLKLEQIFPVQQRLKHVQGQVKILVFLHVQVDELLSRCGSGVLEDRQQLLNRSFDSLLMIPGAMRANHGGNLERNVVNIVARQKPRRLRQTLGCLSLTQHGLAQKVEVEP